MKYKSRIIAFLICMLTFSVLYIITQEPKNKTETSRDDSTPERHYRRFGYLQDKIQEAVGIRKLVKGGEGLLKDERDIRERLLSEKADNEAIMRKAVDEMNKEDMRSDSDKVFEKAILGKFKRYDDNREVPEVNGRTLMYDESVER